MLQYKNSLKKSSILQTILSSSENTNYKMTSKYKAPHGKKLKILCLHGFGTNKQFMKMQTQALTKDFQYIAEFIFVDGPIIVPIQFVADPKVINNLQAPPRSWSDFRIGHKTRSKEEALASLQKIRKSFQQASDHYDGAMCFSQGSQVFQMVLWAQALKLIDWQLINKLKFFINLSADSYRVTLKDLNYQRFEIPSLHFLSEEDFLFNKCIINPTIYKNPEIIFHTFGHRFPLLGLKQKRKMSAFLLRHGLGIGTKSQINEQSKL